MKNLAHSASFQSFDKDAPLKPGTKQLGYIGSKQERMKFGVSKQMHRSAPRG